MASKQSNGQSSSTVGAESPITQNQLRRLEEIYTNIYTSRAAFAKQFGDPRRDIDDECGYPAGIITSQQYQELYDREAVAARVVQVLPRETWQVQPEVYEDEDINVLTPFEKALDSLGQQLYGSSYYATGNKCSPVWEYLRRADELSGIGQYGVLFIAVDDGQRDLSQPARVRKNARVLFLRCFPESMAQINKYEQDVTNPRYGQPNEYLLTFNDPHNLDAPTGVGLTGASFAVHWTRCVHLADIHHAASPSEIFAIPRQKQVLNRLLDLQKLYAGSAEMYWRGAFPGISLETHPQLGGDVDIDIPRTKDMMEQYMNGLQRYLALTGMAAKSLAPQVVDPSKQIACQIEAICIKLGIPKRVFMGSERGELASSQDDAAWNDRLRERQHGYITPRIIIPFIDRLIQLGVLPAPKQFRVWWPDVTSQTNQERASVALTMTQALAQYVGAGVGNIVGPLDFLSRFLTLPEEEAKMIMDRLKEQQKLLPVPPKPPQSSQGGSLEKKEEKDYGQAE